MAGTKQLHVRLDFEVGEQAAERASAMGISLNDWLTRAVLHALAHADTAGEPQPLRLPWSALL